MSRPTKIIINTSAFAHNLQRVKAYAPKSLVLAMVKANAYGHGLDAALNGLREADGFGTDEIDIAVSMRARGVHQKILLMEGMFFPDEIPLIEKEQLDVVIHHLAQVEMIEQAAIRDPLTVWVKINTGMNRLGFAMDQMMGIRERLQRSGKIKEMILMTHFASADRLQDPTTLNQLTQFMQVTLPILAPKSLANSAAIIGWPDSHADWVRPGIMLYGASPFADKSAHELNLVPVMLFQSQIVAIQMVPKGGAIGYGGRYICPETMPVGVIPVGYGDGYPRTAADGTPVWVDGQCVPLIGHVSMDRLTVDLRTHPQVKIGSPVECWGKHLSVDDVAKHAQTIGYELLCRVTDRPQYHII